MARVGPQRHRKQKKKKKELWDAEYRLIKNFIKLILMRMGPQIVPILCVA